MSGAKGKATPDDVYIGQRLRAVRKSMGWSQETLANAINVKFQQVQKYENGTNRLSLSKLCEVCRALQVSPAYFLPDDVVLLFNKRLPDEVANG